MREQGKVARKSREGVEVLMTGAEPPPRGWMLFGGRRRWKLEPGET